MGGAVPARARTRRLFAHGPRLAASYPPPNEVKRAQETQLGDDERTDEDGKADRDR